MTTIKFSHRYVKMPLDFKKSILTRIELVDIGKLSPEFLDQDSAIVGGGNYPLPKKGRFMVLHLKSTSLQAEWQTIRRWTPGKESFYRKRVGEVIQCVIIQEEGKEDG